MIFHRIPVNENLYILFYKFLFIRCILICKFFTCYNYDNFHISHIIRIFVQPSLKRERTCASRNKQLNLLNETCINLSINVYTYTPE